MRPHIFEAVWMEETSVTWRKELWLGSGNMGHGPTSLLLATCAALGKSVHTLCFSFIPVIGTIIICMTICGGAWVRFISFIPSLEPTVLRKFKSFMALLGHTPSFTDLQHKSCYHFPLKQLWRISNYESLKEQTYPHFSVKKADIRFGV